MSGNPVLIIEDDQDLRGTMKDLLELQGFEAVTAANGQEGLSRLNEMAGCGMILLDLMMPVMNGWEFLDILRQQEGRRFGNIPVVVVSAAASGSPQENRYGCTVIRKPVDVALMMALVERHCRGGS